jgi:hypothetical protein
MGRMYTVIFSAIAVTAAQDLFELVAPSGTGIKLHAVFLSQSNSTTSAQLRTTIKRGEGTVTSGAAGSAPTPVPAVEGDAAATFTAEVNNTTRMVVGSGAIKTLHDDAFNVLSGWVYLPTPDMRFTAKPGDRLVVGLETAPGSSLTMSGVAYVEELN